MKHDAEVNAAQDQQKKAGIDLKNQAEAVIFSLEKLIKDAGDKMPAEQKTELTGKLQELKTLKDQDKYDELKPKLEEINALAQSIGAAMYSNQKSDVGNPMSDLKSNANGNSDSANTSDAKKDKLEPMEGEFTEKK